MYPTAAWISIAERPTLGGGPPGGEYTKPIGCVGVRLPGPPAPPGDYLLIRRTPDDRRRGAGG